MEVEVIVKDMTPRMIELYNLSNHKRNHVNHMVFVPALIKTLFDNKADRAEEAFWVEVNRFFPEYKGMNQSQRKDYCIVFKKYTDKVK